MKAERACFYSLKVVVPVLRRQNRPDVQAALLESLARSARAEVVATELLAKFLVPVDDSEAPLDLRFGGESPPSLAHRLEKNDPLSRSCVFMVHLLRKGDS